MKQNLKKPKSFVVDKLIYEKLEQNNLSKDLQDLPKEPRKKLTILLAIILHLIVLTLIFFVLKYQDKDYLFLKPAKVVFETKTFPKTPAMQPYSQQNNLQATPFGQTALDNTRTPNFQEKSISKEELLALANAKKELEELEKAKEELKIEEKKQNQFEFPELPRYQGLNRLYKKGVGPEIDKPKAKEANSFDNIKISDLAKIQKPGTGDKILDFETREFKTPEFQKTAENELTDTIFEKKYKEEIIAQTLDETQDKTITQIQEETIKQAKKETQEKSIAKTKKETITQANNLKHEPQKETETKQQDLNLEQEIIIRKLDNSELNTKIPEVKQIYKDKNKKEVLKQENQEIKEIKFEPQKEFKETLEQNNLNKIKKPETEKSLHEKSSKTDPRKFVVKSDYENKQTRPELENLNMGQNPFTKLSHDYNKKNSDHSNSGDKSDQDYSVKNMDLKEISKGFLDYSEQQGGNFIQYTAAIEGAPTEKQLQHERYIKKIFDCIENTMKIKSNTLMFYKPVDPSQVLIVTINIMLNNDGKVDDVSIAQPSGYPEFDRFMLSMLTYSSSAFPPVPNYLSKDKYYMPVRFLIPAYMVDSRTRNIMANF